MKISPSYQTNFYTNTYEKKNQKHKEQTPQNKEFTTKSTLIQSNYNLAFCGLFRQKPIDATTVDTPIKMIPKKEYLISDNAKFRLGKKCIIDLQNHEIKYEIKKLRPNEKIIIGREGFKTENMDKCISRQHLEISKNQMGELIAKDLNSLNGTTIEQPSPKRFDDTDIKKLSPNKQTIIPTDVQLKLGTDLIIDMRNPNILNLLDEKGTITIGRGAKCDLVIDDFHNCTSRHHLSLSKENGQIVTTDLNSTNGTYVIPKNKIKAFYNGAKNLELSQSNVGDCFLLSTIYAMSRTDAGAKMLENMVEVDDEGNYIVSFFNYPPIKVKPEELDGQKSIFGNEEKYSVSGELGIKALERAYGKRVKVFYSPRTMFAEIDSGGFMDTALFKMTGITSKKYNLAKDNLRPILFKLKMDGVNNHILTCSTPKYGKYGRYADKEYRFISNHAYAIDDINLNKEQITIVDPHNTRQKHIISWKDFSQTFDYLCDAKIS